MITADFHTHTSFSSDCSVSPDEMVQGAVQKGLQTICITDHKDQDYPEPGVFNPDLDTYVQELSLLQKKMTDQIDVRIGIELGLQPHLNAYYQELTRTYPFDFVIGSIHLLSGKDPSVPEFFESKRDEDVYRAALTETLECIRAVSDFDVLGHLDYTVRYGKEREKQYSYERFSEEIDAILRHLISHGKGLEINTAGLKYGLPFAHPIPAVMKRYRELGGEIVTIGSDGHKPEHLAYDFHVVRDLMETAGLAYYTEFRQRKPIFRKIS